MVKTAGCPPSDSFKDWLSFVFWIPQTSKFLYAVHALKGSSIFLHYQTGRAGSLWDWLSPGVPVFELQLLLKTRGWLPAAVSGRESCSKLEGRLPSVDRTRNFCRHGAGCLQWSRVPGAFVDTGAGCSAVVSGSRGFCRHGAGCLQWSRAPGAFVDTGAGCSAVVSGSRGFCRHGAGCLQWSRAPGALVGERAGCPPRLGLRRRACVD